LLLLLLLPPLLLLLLQAIDAVNIGSAALLYRWILFEDDILEKCRLLQQMANNKSSNNTAFTTSGWVLWRGSEDLLYSKLKNRVSNNMGCHECVSTLFTPRYRSEAEG
jgi:hypothetical protein